MRTASWSAGEIEFFTHAPEFEPFSGLRSPECNSSIIKFVVVIIIYMMLLCPYFAFIDTFLSKHVHTFFDFGFCLLTSEV